MKKLFLIFLLIIIASIQSHAMVEKSVRCMSLFAKGNASLHINDMLAPFQVKKDLLRQTIQSKGIHDFVIEFSELADKLYLERFVEALDGKKSIDPKELGFKSSDELRTWKEVILSKLVKVLSIMDSSDMTPEFSADFLRILTRMYDHDLKKSEILNLNTRLDSVIISYSANRFIED